MSVQAAAAAIGISININPYQGLKRIADLDRLTFSTFQLT